MVYSKLEFFQFVYVYGKYSDSNHIAANDTSSVKCTSILYFRYLYKNFSRIKQKVQMILQHILEQYWDMLPSEDL